MVLGALAGAAAVALGAFGAHYIKDLLSPSRFDIYQTAAQYLMVHAIVLYFTGYLAVRHPGRLLTIAGFSFLLGMVAFSGSLFLLSVSGIRIMGAIAPIGGSGFIVGWLLLAVVAWKNSFDKADLI